jgi:glycine betaine/proline transport system ATP-binding protein
VQCGTARQIIANPVSDYVADFVAHMNPLSVLTARDVMERGVTQASQSVDAETPVKTIMAAMRDGAGEIAVTEAGARIGVLRAAHVMGRLVNPRG